MLSVAVDQTGQARDEDDEEEDEENDVAELSLIQFRSNEVNLCLRWLAYDLASPLKMRQV